MLLLALSALSCLLLFNFFLSCGARVVYVCVCVCVFVGISVCIYIFLSLLFVVVPGESKDALVDNLALSQLESLLYSSSCIFFYSALLLLVPSSFRFSHSSQFFLYLSLLVSIK